MMADDQLGPLADRLGGRRARDRQTGHDSIHGLGRIAPDQADIVPGLGQVRGRELVEPAGHVGDGGHCVIFQNATDFIQEAKRPCAVA